MSEKSFVKVIVPFETSVPGEFERESLWASPTEDGYEFENIPFYVQGLAFGDVVTVNKVSDGGLDYDHLVRESGHSSDAHGIDRCEATVLRKRRRAGPVRLRHLTAPSPCL